MAVSSDYRSGVARAAQRLSVIEALRDKSSIVGTRNAAAHCGVFHRGGTGAILYRSSDRGSTSVLAYDTAAALVA